jgi:MbtH protein
MSSDDVDERQYQVVLNDEEQYSIWLADRPLPLGWYAEGTTGTRETCLAHIAVIWTDMRPLSLRRRMSALSEVSQS